MTQGSASPSARNWTSYYDAVGGRPPRETLLKALGAFETEGVSRGHAIDLGAGSGRDALELLRRGWTVLAIDGEAAGLEELKRQAAAASQLQLLKPRLSLFEELQNLPPALLINASFSLPFCHPEAFPKLWYLIAQSLLPGGRFAGQLLGDEDDWAKEPGVTCFDRDDLDQLFSGYQIEHLLEEKKKGTTAKGKSKFWHLYHIVLQRRAS